MSIFELWSLPNWTHGFNTGVCRCFWARERERERERRILNTCCLAILHRPFTQLPGPVKVTFSFPLFHFFFVCLFLSCRVGFVDVKFCPLSLSFSQLFSFSFHITRCGCCNFFWCLYYEESVRLTYSTDRLGCAFFLMDWCSLFLSLLLFPSPISFYAYSDRVWVGIEYPLA